MTKLITTDSTILIKNICYEVTRFTSNGIILTSTVEKKSYSVSNPEVLLMSESELSQMGIFILPF